MMDPRAERVVVGGLVATLAAVSAGLAVAEALHRYYRWRVHREPLPRSNGSTSTSGATVRGLVVRR
jgi:hypothetical protein